MPRDFGDAHDVVVRIHLNFEGFEWLVNELEYGTGTRMCEDGAVREFREELEAIRKETGRG